LFTRRWAFTIPTRAAVRSGGRCKPILPRITFVFSLVGVLAITLLLFLAVALTARLILGR